MTLSWFLRQGSPLRYLHDGFWKSDHDFLIALHSNFLSGMHGFQDNEVLLQAGYDVIVISQPGVAPRYFTWRILKGRLQLYIHVQLTLFVYLERFRRYFDFLYLAGISLLGAKFWGFWGKMIPKTSNERKTLAGRALPYAKLRLLSHCTWNYLYPFDLCRWARKKGSKAGRK